MARPFSPTMDWPAWTMSPSLTATSLTCAAPPDHARPPLQVLLVLLLDLLGRQLVLGRLEVLDGLEDVALSSARLEALQVAGAVGRRAGVGRVGGADELHAQPLEARREGAGGLEELRRRVLLVERDGGGGAGDRSGRGGARLGRGDGLVVHDLPPGRELDVDLARLDHVRGQLGA